MGDFGLLGNTPSQHILDSGNIKQDCGFWNGIQEEEFFKLHDDGDLEDEGDNPGAGRDIQQYSWKKHREIWTHINAC